MQPQVLAILRAIEERITELVTLATDPNGRVSQAQTDALRTYGLVAQLAEVTGIQRDQVLALTDAMSIYLGKLIEHDRRMIAQHDTMLGLLRGLAHGIGATEIAQHAEDARAILQSEAEARLAEIELSADEARALLSVARMDARAVVRAAVDRAQDEIAAAAEAARAALANEETG
jgi:hypothetical protein